MLVEVFGGGFTNKGAELMLRTVVSRLREARPDVRICLEPSEANYRQRAELGLEHIFPPRALLPGKAAAVVGRFATARYAYNLSRLALPQSAATLLGLVPQGGADAMLDIQGYAYGDKFHPMVLRAATVRAKLYARQGKPVVLMPQMLGPFENPQVKEEFIKLAAFTDLIYARDSHSRELAARALGTADKLRLAPDLTIFSHEESLQPEGLPERPFVCIVPNVNLLRLGGNEWRGRYLERLSAAASHLSKLGLVPLFMVHERAGPDESLAQDLASRVGASLFVHDNPLVLKAAISRARFLIGSRFHSIVAALSSGVPSIALGWAHKYPALLEDFGIPELIHQGEDDPSQLLALVDRLSDESENSRLRQRLQQHKSAMREQVESMWRDVLGLLYHDE